MQLENAERKLATITEQKNSENEKHLKEIEVRNWYMHTCTYVRTYVYVYVHVYIRTIHVYVLLSLICDCTFSNQVFGVF